MLARLSSLLLQKPWVFAARSALVEPYFTFGSVLHHSHLGISLGQGFIP